MRLSVIFAFMLVAAPAAGQPIACETSLTSDAGEVIASVDVRGRTTITWVVPRSPGIGQQTDHTSRPGLMLDFGMKSDGALTDIRAAIVSITSYSDPEIGRAPPLSSFRVRAKLKGAAIEWKADEPMTGEPALARRLKSAWPDDLTVDLIDRKGELVASATFDLRNLSAANALAREARAKCGAG